MSKSRYTGSARWLSDAADAAEHFEVLHHEHSDDERVHYVQAQARTGSRYAVVAARLPAVAAFIEGGGMLVSVLSPFTSTYPLDEFGSLLHWAYVLEKFCPQTREIHGGDLAALTIAIALATGRPYVLPFSEEVRRGVQPATRPGVSPS